MRRPALCSVMICAVVCIGGCSQPSSPKGPLADSSTPAGVTPLPAPIVAGSVPGNGASAGKNVSAPAPSGGAWAVRPLAAVAGSSLRETQPAPAGEAVQPESARTQVTFIDSSAFDSDLSRALKQNDSRVEVLAPAKFSLNQIPPRLEKWLAQVKETGGEVQAEAAPQPGAGTRGLFSLPVELVVALYDKISDRITYGPAQQYDARLHYDKVTGLVDAVDFIKRQ